MKPLVCALCLLAAAAAQATPFTSGQPLPPSSGRGTRVPGTNVSTAVTPTAPNKPATVSKTAAKGAVQQYAENYFTKTYVPGSVGTRVMSAAAKVGELEAVTGWPNKLRATGTVDLVVTYRGKDQKETRRFEAMLEDGKVVDFSPR